MHGLIGRLVANVGVDRAAAEKAVGIILPFRRNECAVDDIAAAIDRRSDACAAPERSHTNSNSGGMLGAIGSRAAGSIRIATTGLGTAEVPAISRKAIGHASQMAGEDAVGDIVGAVPGRFV